jgi:hypothetical protein
VTFIILYKKEGMTQVSIKFPNVNYPPSMEEPKGFSIRYSWTAQIDGPALQSGLKSREYLTPYRPIIVATPGKVIFLLRNIPQKKSIHSLIEVYLDI